MSEQLTAVCCACCPALRDDGFCTVRLKQVGDSHPVCPIGKLTVQLVLDEILYGAEHVEPIGILGDKNGARHG